MHRREFMSRIGGTVLVATGAAAAIRCGDDGQSLPRPGPIDSGSSDARSTIDAASEPDSSSLSCSETIVANHGHVVMVPEEDVLEGEQKTYTLLGAPDDGHTHLLTLTAADMSDLAEGGSITIESSVDSSASFGTHAHNVTVMCS